jgi:hypothetical protein
MVCHELGKGLEEVAHWEMKRIIEWVAYFRLKDRLEAKAFEQARRRAGNR